MFFFLVKPKVSEDTFEDLLGGHQFTKKDEGPKTIKELRKQDEAECTDPIKLKVSCCISAQRRDLVF